MNKNLAVLEGLLFVVGEEGLDLGQIEDVLDLDEEEAKILLKKLREEYERKLIIEKEILILKMLEKQQKEQEK